MKTSGQQFYHHLMTAQTTAWFAVGLLGVSTLFAFGFTGEAIIPIIGCAILGAVGYFGSVIAHELGEVNDQLAGRSPELREWVRGTDGNQVS